MKTKTIPELKSEIEALDTKLSQFPKLEFTLMPRIDRLEWELINHPDNTEKVKKNILRYIPRQEEILFIDQKRNQDQLSTFWSHMRTRVYHLSSNKSNIWTNKK